MRNYIFDKEKLLFLLQFLNYILIKNVCACRQFLPNIETYVIIASMCLDVEKSNKRVHGRVHVHWENT